MVKLRENPDPSFVNLIARCLEWDPKKRLTPDEGLNHEWIIKGLPPGILIQHQQQMQKSRQENPSKNSAEPHPSPRGTKAAASISSSNAS
jgi:dual specificity tyrosine-phosphorylation-regulated kinase 2/3/4